MALPSPTDLVEETVVVGDDPISLLRPRDSDELLEEEAFEQEEFLPYWAELWPSSVALARAVGARALRGAPTLELGCGLGLASIAPARAGGGGGRRWGPAGGWALRASPRRVPAGGCSPRTGPPRPSDSPPATPRATAP